MKYFFTLLSVVFLFSCSSDESSPTPDNPDVYVNPTLLTETPTFANGVLTFKGNVTSLGSGYLDRGFCWSTNPNPTLSDNLVDADGSGLGQFIALKIDFQENTAINIRAYVYENDHITYGNNITYTTPPMYSLTTSIVKNIESTDASFSGNVVSNYDTTDVYEKGFYISTNSIPTLANSEVVITSPTNTLGDFNLTTTNLTKNKVYYVRSYAINYPDRYYYGEVQTFKTTGYLGASGGYVFYDKGEVTDGWRYLESGPTNLTYNSSSLIKWGCAGTAMSQTSISIGTGLENTNRIVANCTDANCAAKICYDYSVNSLSDWFLPSKDELFLLDDSVGTLINLGNATNQNHWSSSEYNQSNGHFVNTYYGSSIGSGVSKNNSNLVRPIRRY